MCDLDFKLLGLELSNFVSICWHFKSFIALLLPPSYTLLAGNYLIPTLIQKLQE